MTKLRALIAKRFHDQFSTNHPNETEERSDVTDKRMSNEHVQQHKNLRPIQKYILDILPKSRSHNKKNLPTERSSIIKTFHFAGENSKKTVTFASIFDLADNMDCIEKLGGSNPGFYDDSINKTEEDLVISVPRRHDDQQEQEIIESYPFRSETNLFDVKNSNCRPVNIGKQRFARRQYSKIWRYPIKSKISNVEINRAKSVPEMFASSLSSKSPVDTSIISNQPHHHALTTIRQWLKLPSLHRLVESFQKPSQTMSHSNKTKLTSLATSQSKPRRKTGDVFY